MTPKPLKMYVVRCHPTRSAKPVPRARVPADTPHLLSVSTLRLWLDGEVIAEFRRIQGFHAENIPSELPRG